MAIPSDKPNSATTRPVPLRVRPDLAIRPQQIGRHRYWVVKDPVALEYFHLRDEEHTILKMLDGQTSLAQIKRRFEQVFAPMQMSIDRLHAFLGRLYRCGLLLSDTPGQGDQLSVRHGRRRRRELTQSLTGVLAIRFRGIDPEPLLRWLYPKCRWLFSPWFLVGCLLLALLAATLLAVRFDVLQAKLPEFHAFFNARNVIWLAVTLALAKVLHELGHALACKHFGGECHELGIMLLVFTPCLYCNVSDAWMLPNKWHRVAISAAGMCVEIVLACICTFLWWFSEPGLLNTLCLNMMFVCSVSTILFNGNPLLRYDGYYILSDVAEVPNLGQQSKALVSRALARFFLGIETHDDRELPQSHRGLLAAYGVASTVYRWAVVIGILWFCAKVLKPYGLQVIAQGLAAIVLVGLLMAPIWSIVRFVGNPSWRRRMRRVRAALTCGILLAAAVAVCLLPLPFRVSAPVVIEPQSAHRVYVSVPGRLVASVSPGEEVQTGQELGRLVNLDIQRQIEELAGRRNQQELHVENLKNRRADPGVAVQIPGAKEALADIEQRLHQRQQDQQRLVLTSPAEGTVVPGPSRRGQPFTPGRLDFWQGSPLDERNLGAYLDIGTLFCLVGDPERLQAVLVVDQSDIKFVRTGQRVRIQLDETPAAVLGGTIVEIGKTDVKVAPRELAGGSDLLVRVAEDGIPRPLETSYQARVSLDEYDRQLLIGTRGRAKILADPQSLGRRLYRFLRRTFTL